MINITIEKFSPCYQCLYCRNKDDFKMYFLCADMYDFYDKNKYYELYIGFPCFNLEFCNQVSI